MNAYRQQYLLFCILIFCFVQCTKQKTDTCQNVQTLAINPKQINPIKFSNLFSAQEVIKVTFAVDSNERFETEVGFKG